MTCESALTKYAHAKELTNFEGLQERGACYFPKAYQEWISPHVVRMEACSIKSKQLGLLSQPALLKFEVYQGFMSECVVRQKSPLPGSQTNHQGSCCCVLSLKLVHKHDDRNKGEKLPTKCIYHIEVGLPRVSWISQDRRGYC